MKQFLYIFIVVAALAVVALIGYLLYYRSAGSAPAETQTGALPGAPTQSNQSAQTTRPAAGQQTPSGAAAGQKFGVVAQNPVINFYVDSQNNAVLIQPDGQIIKVAAGNSSVLNSVAIPNLIGASFSFDGKKILASFGDPSSPQESLFDVENKTWQPLSQNLQSAAWSPNSYQIAYLANKNGVPVLTVFDPTNANTKPTELATLHINDVALNWLNPNKIIISDKGSAYVTGSVWSFDVKNKTLVPLALNTLGLQSIWNDAAGMGLVFGTKSGGFGGVLSLTDSTTGHIINALTFLALPSKCVFDVETQNAAAAPATSTATTSSKQTKTVTAPPIILRKSLYCAIPRDSQMFNASVLPDDYLGKALFTTDDISKTNLTTGDTSALFADSSQNLDADILKIFNKTLFFINRFDRKLYAISLGQ
jgi:hypothetical protein